MSRILIIEDDRSIAELERDYLEINGFETTICDDGQQGLKEALDGEYDLIILDLMLPGADGFEICRIVRERKNTPIIIVSAKHEDIDKIRGLGLGADDYMHQPAGLGERRGKGLHGQGIRPPLVPGVESEPCVYQRGAVPGDLGHGERR